MNKETLLAFLQKHRGLGKALFALHNRIPFVNRWRQAPETRLGLSLLKGCRFSGGKGNTLVVGDFARLKGCHFHFEGTGNKVLIGDRCLCDQTEFWIEGSGNTITLGEHTALCGKSQLAALEGTEITIGRDCLFADSLKLRTGDSHSLLDRATRQRVNPAASITIGDHVWIGTNVTVLKGTRVADNCMIGACALLSGQYETPNCVLAGVPAKQVREGIDWTSALI